MKNASPTGPARLAIGVTGHLDLCGVHLAKLRTAIADALRLFPSPSRSSAAVLSALARGADRLAADVALDMGFELVAILPMPPDRYAASLIEHSGDTRESVQDFWRLLARAADTCIVAPSTAAPEAAYVAVGREIARRSDVLLALWDGAGPKADGGTGWVVNERRGPVYRIAVHRQDQCPTNFSRFEAGWLDAGIDSERGPEKL